MDGSGVLYLFPSYFRRVLNSDIYRRRLGVVKVEVRLEYCQPPPTLPIAIGISKEGS
jgi:hypothetical protein